MYNTIYIVENQVKCQVSANRYIKFIKSRINLNLSRQFKNIKYESHHILPRSMGGTDDKCNIVKLTLREHFIAHLFLALCYKNKSMTCALRYMRNKQNKNSRLYEKYRSHFIESMSGKNNPMYGKKSAMYGKKHTDETKKKISNSLLNNPTIKGRPSNRKGEKLSYETKKKISLKSAGKNNGMYGKNHTDEAKKKISDLNRGKTSQFKGKSHTDETKKKLSDLNKGKPSQFKGKSHTDESKNKIRKKYSVNNIIYIGRDNAAMANNISKKTLTIRCNSIDYPNYFIIYD